MATTNYSWNLPTVGGSEDTWGTLLNANWTALDTLLGGTNATEFEILDGATVTTAELNILDGVTASTAEINILDGLTATTAELNILDGVTATTAEINILDGVTATAAELNVLDGIAGIASQAEAEAGTATDKLMTPQRTAQAISALSVLSEFYESAEQTITTGGLLDLSHGLSGTPKLVKLIYKCTTAEFGYSVGDEVSVSDIDSTRSTGTVFAIGAASVATSTKVKVRFGSTSGIPLLDFSTGANQTGTPANWALIVRAWA